MPPKKKKHRDLTREDNKKLSIALRRLGDREFIKTSDATLKARNKKPSA